MSRFTIWAAVLGLVGRYAVLHLRGARLRDTADHAGPVLGGYRQRGNRDYIDYFALSCA